MILVITTKDFLLKIWLRTILPKLRLNNKFKLEPKTSNQYPFKYLNDYYIIPEYTNKFWSKYEGLIKI